MAIRFYIGLHQPSDAQRFARCCIHVQRLATRRMPLGCTELLLDSRAFNELRLHGRYRSSAAQFADQVHRSRTRLWLIGSCPSPKITCVRPRSSVRPA